jgi:hypothetical protein
VATVEGGLQVFTQGIRSLLWVLVSLAMVTPAAAKVSLKTCKQTCTTQVETSCVGLRKGKLKRCRGRLLKQCKRGRIVCAPGSSTTTSLPSAPGCASTFLVGAQLPGGTDQGVATADLNEDGKVDILILGDPAVMARLGNGDGTFGDLLSWDIGGDPRGIAVADLDGDTHVDLAVANFDDDPPPTGPSTVVNLSVLRGHGDGTFEAPVPYFVGNYDFNHVAAGDFDADGKIDLVVATRPSLVVLKNLGGGAFGPGVEYPLAELGRSVAVADLNGDDKLDLAATEYGPPGGPGAITIFFGDGDGAFGAPQSHVVGRVPYSIVAGDVDGNGTVDLATANNNSADMSVLIGDGTGVFAPTVDYDAGGLPTSLAGGDFNGDGRLDFAISAGPNGSVGMFRGVGNGTFGAVVPSLTFGSAAVASGDFDGDGRADVVSASPLGHRILLSRCP